MSFNSWMYYLPEFESDKYNPEMMKYSPWSGHRAFAYDYVVNVRPNRIVELGSYYGCSAFSFLQAIKDYKLNTEFWAIDTWAGDSFTKTDYQEDIYGHYKVVHDACFTEQRSNMLRMTFDEAISEFEDETIDLLHIDGSHLYEDVKHDFEAWRCKVKKKGAIFFHDVSSDELEGELLGSHVFWNEIKKIYPYTVEFGYSFGLGILFFDKEIYERILNTVSLEHYQNIVNHFDVKNKDVIRKSYFEIRDLKEYIQFLERQLDVSRQNIGRYEEDVEKKNQYIESLEKRATDLSDELRISFEQSQNAIGTYQKDIEILKKAISDKEIFIADLQVAIFDYKSTVEGKETYIRELLNTIEKYDVDVAGKEQYINKLQRDVEQLNALSDDKQQYIEELQGYLKDYEELVTEKDKYVTELQNGIQRYGQDCEAKQRYIDELIEAINAYDENLAGKDKYIESLRQVIETYTKTVEAKDVYINNLERRLRQLEEQLLVKTSYSECLEDEVHKLQTHIRVNDEELERSRTLYEALLHQHKTTLLRNVDMQKSLEETYAIMNNYKSELSGSIIGRWLLKRMGSTND